MNYLGNSQLKCIKKRLNIFEVMRHFWDNRYASREYVYGVAPNTFFKEQIEKIKPGKILFAAEGEGRNAVCAAMKGWEVYAFDISAEGKKKADFLAKSQNVSINYDVQGYESISYPELMFDCLVLVYAHMPDTIRERIHRKLLGFVKFDGTVIMEAFSKEQINYKSGGPPTEIMLFSEDEIKSDFAYMKKKKVWKEEINLSEGDFHKGKASVIRMVGTK